ncbi:hypothetical protein [Methylosarcina fibrata]|jgi:hypothetical protein|uniref:hypothetical protein n=1 Tax=Methylosarcina fibrata TaxID=105972 RepID=UPI00036CD0AE|nr:hypothetical protein [Methylosarcina fibrata]
MSTPVEELIREIAANHGIAVGRDDPIMILHTLNKRLLMDSHNVQQELLRRFEENLEAATKRWGDESKARAERIVNAALDASRQTLDEAAAIGAKSAVDAVRKEMERGANVVTDRVNSLRWLVMVNVVASVVALGAAVLALSGQI